MNPALLVLAAGMGSRYGGLKQMDPVGPSGEVVLDYSVHDAVAAGFKKVVFVIRKDFEAEFRRQVVARFEKKVEVAIVFQETTDLPEGYHASAERTKPFGTGHAIWCARHSVTEPFLVVNADDFYGMEAFYNMSHFLRESSTEFSGLKMGMVAYPLMNTLSEHGTVSRGICTVTEDQMLAKVEEHTNIQRMEDRITAIDVSGVARELKGDEMVSMNFWGFSPAIFDHLERLLGEFLDSGGLENPKSEFYIPSAVTSIIAQHSAPASVLISNGRWLGVTYQEDRLTVTKALQNMVDQRLYPSPLWSQ